MKARTGSHTQKQSECEGKQSSSSNPCSSCRSGCLHSGGHRGPQTPSLPSQTQPHWLGWTLGKDGCCPPELQHSILWYGLGWYFNVIACISVSPAEQCLWCSQHTDWHSPSRTVVAQQQRCWTSQLLWQLHSHCSHSRWPQRGEISTVGPEKNSFNCK